jgi:PAS domain S-box-containing protein
MSSTPDDTQRSRDELILELRELRDRLSRQPGEASSSSVGATAPASLGAAIESVRGAPLGDARSARILVVEDDETTRRCLAELLGEHWQVETAAHGGAALDAIRLNAPDLLLTDVLMPGVSGLEVLKAVRANPLTAMIPVILLSGQGEEESQIAGFEAGADDYIHKPFSPAQLLARVAANLRLSRQRQEAIEMYRSAEARLALLAEASEALMSSLRSEAVLPGILELSKRLISADGFAVWRLQASGEWKAVTSWGVSANYLEAAGRASGESLPAPETPLVLEDPVQEPTLDCRSEAREAEGIVSMLVLPMRLRGEIQATLAFYYRERHKFSEVEMRLANALASLASTALGAAEAHEQQVRLREEAEEASRALRDSQQRYQELVDVLDGIVWEADPETFEFRLVSKQAERLLGYPCEQWLTERGFWLSRVHAADRDWVWQFCQQELAVRNYYQLEYRMIAADGRVVWLRDFVSVTEGAGGRRQVSGVKVDVTGRKETEGALRKNQELLRTVTDAMPALIAYVGHDRVFRFSNLAYQEWFGWPVDEINGRTMAEVFGPDMELIEPHIRRVLAGNPVRFETWLPHGRGGGRRYVEGTYLPHLSASGHVEGFFALIIDLTQRKRDEQEKEALAAQIGAHRRRLIDIISNVPGVVWEAWGQPDSASQRIDFISPYAEKMLGHSVEEWLATPNFWLTVVHPDDRERAAREAAAIFASGQGGVSSFRWVGRDGRILWVEAHSVVIVDDKGKPAGMRGVTMDITERLVSQQRIARLNDDLQLRIVELQTLLDVIPAGIAFAEDPGCESIFANRWFSSLLGVPQSMKLQKDASGVSKLPFRAFQEGREIPSSEWPMLKSAATAELLRDVELDVICPDGREVRLLCSAAPISDAQGRVRGSVGAFLDISERRRIEETVLRLNQTLEERVKERTAALQETKDQMEAFCYSVSHDLRAPLRAMQGFTAALIEDYGELLDRVGRDYADRVRLAAQRMDLLILDLLEYSRLGRMELAMADANLESLVRNALEELAPEIERTRAEISVDRINARVFVNETVMGQVLINLIGNSLKFVAAGVVPSIRITSETRQRWVRLSIRDNGIGIAKEHHERIFRVFERLHGLDVYPGTGIGLAIVRKGVERMGGRVGLESAEGQGSCFWIELRKVFARGASVSS